MPLYWPVKPISNPFGPQPPTRMAPHVPFGHNGGRMDHGSHTPLSSRMHHTRHGRHAHHGARMHRTAARAAATHKQETRFAHP